ncbi:MAG TPA: NAD-dependent epimerase/dehydratase family protein [Leucothrix mucor]|nr:NAD-dependent epimerase/dehydratase family protein [Leucothrix mucor]
MDNNLWIIGCGDIGCRVASLYLSVSPHQQAGGMIHAVVSSEESKARCEGLGLEAHAINLDDNNVSKLIFTLSNKMANAKLFYFAPPPSIGREDTRFKNFLSSLNSLPKRIVLISTTGVYGDSQGEWIDEDFAVNPKADRAHRRLSAEKALQQWAEQYSREYIILRVPGIYAKNRLPLARLKKGLPVVNGDEAGWTNRIHADDLATICQQAMASDINGEIYNVTDGNPSTMTEYFNQVADYAGLAHPPQISMQEAEATMSVGMVSYLRESRRISNQKMLRELDVALLYPYLQLGLKK